MKTRGEGDHGRGEDRGRLELTGHASPARQILPDVGCLHIQSVHGVRREAGLPAPCDHAGGMRNPTLNEATRKADREIMTEILKWSAKGRGSVEAGLAHYAASPDEALWKLMAQQPESLPGQGNERQVKGAH